MLPPLRRHHDVADRQARVHATSNARENDPADIEVIDHRLGRRCGVHHADAGEDQYDWVPFEAADVVSPPCDLYGAFDARGCEQAIEFGRYGGDDHDTLDIGVAI
jgi:hypothetical protein